jgi:hypothetical protein
VWTVFLAEERDMAVNLQVPLNVRITKVAKQLLDSQEGFSSM